MRYFVDGNNLAIFLFGKCSRGDIRQKILNYLLRYNLPTLTIVFDGPSCLNEVRKGKLQVLFSNAKKADDIILHKITREDFVVTNDLILQSKCRLKGAKPISLRDFINNLKPKVVEGEKPNSVSDIEEWLEIFSGKKDGKRSF